MVAPSADMKAALVPLEERIFMPLICEGSVIGFFECMVPTCRCAKQNFTSFISAAAYLRYQASSAAEPGPGWPIRNGSSPAAKMGKRPAW
jgi:hypothetical protein